MSAPAFLKILFQLLLIILKWFLKSASEFQGVKPTRISCLPISSPDKDKEGQNVMQTC